MSRRRTIKFLAFGLVLAIVCLATVTIGASTNFDEPTPKQLPSGPENLSTKTVSAYVTEYEEVRHNNKVLSDTEETITDLETSCSVVTVDSDQDVYVVTVECNHSYQFISGSSKGIADGAPYQITYRVWDDRIEQIGNRRWV